MNWSIELDKHPELGFHQTLKDQWRECNAEFGKFFENNYESWLRGDDPSAPKLSPQIADKFLCQSFKMDVPHSFSLLIACV